MISKRKEKKKTFAFCFFNYFLFQKNIWLFAGIRSIKYIWFFLKHPNIWSYIVYFSLTTWLRETLYHSDLCSSFFSIFLVKTFKQILKTMKICNINTLLNINKSLSLSRYSLVIWWIIPSFTLKYITSNLSKSRSLLSSVPIINM